MSSKKRSKSMKLDDELEKEWRQFVSDFYKQIATLSGVGLVVVLAIYRESIVGSGLLTTSLIMFALAASSSIMGLYRFLAWFPYERSEERPSIPFLASLSFGFLLQGIAVILTSALELPNWVVYVVIAVALGILASMFKKTRNSLKSIYRRWSK